jgi:hypothetical protein
MRRSKWAWTVSASSSPAIRTAIERPLSCTETWLTISVAATATRPLLAMFATVSAAVATGT